MNFVKDIIISDVTAVITVKFVKGNTVQIKNRDCYGIAFSACGQITYTANGKKYISSPDNVILLPQNGNYSIYGDKTGLFPVINFKSSSPLWNEISSVPINDVAPLIKEYEQLKSLFLFDNNRLKTISVLYSFLHRLFVDKENADHILTPAIKYITQNFDNPVLTNSTLAQKCNISEVYFRKLFLQKYGLSPKQYIIDIRLNHAKQLLCEGDYKINAIAEKSGFSNQYHFCRIFKKNTGLTPTEYMKQNRIYKI